MTKDGTIQPFGAVSYWTLAAKTERAHVRAALVAARLHSMAATLPKRTPASRLQAVLRDRYASDRTIIRPLAKNRGYQVTSERRTGDRNEYQESKIVHQDEHGYLEFVGTTPSEEAGILADYEAELQIMRPADLGAILKDAARNLLGASLRTTGGIYWIPETSLPQWETLAAGLPKSTVYRIRHSRDPEALAAVLDAVARETEQEVQEVRAALAQDPGTRGCRSQVHACEALAARLRKQEQALGQPLQHLRDLADQAARDSTAALMLALAAR